LKRLLTVSTVILLIVVISSPAPGHAQSTSLSNSRSDWPTWGGDLGNQRYNGAESAITAASVQQLALKWTFAFPDTMVAANEPIVIGDTVYVGSWNGHVYALAAATGQLRWDFFDGITGKNVPVRASLVVVNGLVIFGDMAGRVFAVNQSDGSLAWLNDKIEIHPYRQITGSLTAYGDRVYVPMASAEEDAASKSDYACCTFRGSLTALNVRDGSIAWRFFTVDPPQARNGLSKTSTPVELPTLSAPTNYANSSDTADPIDPFGPSGVAVWSTPAIDPDAGLIYLTTGNSYSAPDSPNSDAILAVNMKDGTLRWSTQLLSGDVWNGRCEAPNPNPPAPTAIPCAGTDDDFSSSPLLTTVNGHKQVFGIQKNGQLSALDALTGKKLWQQSVGTRTAINWGPSFDGQHLYSGDASYDRNGQLYALNPLSGHIDWQVPMPGCIPGPAVPADKCWSGNMTTVSSSPGLVWIGAMDGQAYAFDATTGQVRWHFNTARPPGTLHPVNGVAGHGGSLAVTGFTIANGQIYITSGYNQWTPSFMLGNMLFVFGLPAVERF
jgi:polyvinyl alcohol dehydrogenase (cytochrome)